jgi:hypothetical protein
MECANCPLRDDENLCVQYLGESFGWQWFTRTDASAENCHFNFMDGKEHDPYIYKRKSKEII